MNGMEAGHSDIDVSIVIVNYRVKYFLEQTVRSAKEALAGFSGEIIVVDNNSGDDSIEHLRKCFPDVIVIENRENAGFGRANNQGFAIARGKFTLILNPDTIIGSHTLRDCMDFYDKHADDCGGIGVCMLDGNGRFLPESKRAFPTPWVSFCKIFGLSSLFPKSPLFAKYHLRYLPYDRPHRVDILSGAFIFIRTDLLRSIGGFDEDFFMYGEDIDLSYRIVKAGYSKLLYSVAHNTLQRREHSEKFISLCEGVLRGYADFLPQALSALQSGLWSGDTLCHQSALMDGACSQVCGPLAAQKAA